MNNWTNAIVERLDAAYRVRFDKDEALIFLNDAYQNLLILEMKDQAEKDEKLEQFIRIFMEVRDLFIDEVVDRYPSNFETIAEKIETLHTINEAAVVLSK